MIIEPVFCKSWVKHCSVLVGPKNKFESDLTKIVFYYIYKTETVDWD